MALQIFDRIKERVQAGAGTGNLTLLGAPTGFKTFSSRLSISDTTYYCIEGPNGAFEIGVGTLSSSTTLVRTTVLRSSNSDGVISVGASGQYFVFISYIADKAVYRNTANEVVVPSEGFRFSDNTTQITSPTAAIALKADIASPTFTGVPSAPTATGGTNTTQIATTSFVSSAIAAVDLSVYVQKTSSTGSLILPSGTTAQRDVSPVAGYSRWNTTTSRFERWTGSVWENYVRLSGDTMTGALSLGSNGLTCGAVTASGDITHRFSGMIYDNLKLDQSGYSSTAVMTINGGIAGSPQIKFSPKTSNDANLIEGTGATTFQMKAQTIARLTGGSTDFYVFSGKFQMEGDGVIKNGLTATNLLLNKSYTSSSNQEGWMFDAGKQISGKLGLYSYRGSSGGSNYPIQIGMLATDGTTFSGLSIATNGQITSGYTAMQDGFRVGSCMSTNWSSIYQVKLHPNTWIGWDSVGETGNSVDIQLNRKSLGKLAVRGDNGLCVRNLADSADAALTCGAITASAKSSFPLGFQVGSYGHFRSDGTYGMIQSFYNNGNGTATATSSFLPTVASGFSLGEVGYTGWTYLLLQSGSGTAILRPAATDTVEVRNSSNTGAGNLACGAITANGNLTLSDTNLITGTTTGTIIATANSQKLGFWGATPIVQPTASVAAATLVSNGGTTLTDTDLFDGYTLKQIVKALRIAGFLA